MCTLAGAAECVERVITDTHCALALPCCVCLVCYGASTAPGEADPLCAHLAIKSNGVVGGSDSDFIALGAPYVDLFSLKFRGVDLVFKVYEPETVSKCTVQKHGPRARSLGLHD